MKKLLTIVFAVLAGAMSALGQTSTVVTGTIKDLTGTVVPAGQVTFDLRPGVSTTISGNARFTPQTVTCTINQAQNGGSGTITSLVRSGNVVTAQFSSQPTFIVGDVITLAGWSDSTFNGTSAFTVTGASGTTPWPVTWAQTAANSSATGGLISALRANPGPGSCTVTQNTALIPSGTFYQVGIWPSFARTAVFNFYALTNSVDLSAVTPTPGQTPAYSFVDIFQNQTINGNKTFTGVTLSSGTIGGPVTFSGTVTFNGNGIHTGTETFTGPLVASSFSSAATNPAVGGVLRLGTNDSINFRNAANSNDVIIEKASGGNIPADTIGILTGGIGFFAAFFSDNLFNSNVAATGFLRLTNTDKVAWRDVANNGDDGMGVNSSDNPTWANFPSGAVLPMTLTFTTASSVALGTGLINSNACAAPVTVVASGVAAGEQIVWAFTTDPNTVTGYGAGATGALSVYAFTTSGNMNVRVCNLTAGGITPGAISVTLKVIR